jgi:ketosteroid isomerase-like protein
VSALEARVRELEDILEIEQLKATYCYSVDDGDLDALMARFCEDAVWDGGPIGRFEGSAAIRAFLAGLPEQLGFWLHLVMNPDIRVDGDRATARWYLIEPCSGKGRRGDRAIWGAGTYDERYVRRDGEWKFAEITLRPVFWTPFEEGWVERRSLFS